MEILAPAGDMAALKSAVASGADAVYLGTKDFNARSKAENFDDEQLRLAISYCHDRGVKVYITFNTLVKTTEMENAVKAAVKAYEAGADAFIVQDLGFLHELQKRLPDIPYHASTQMGIHNAPGALFAERVGFDRVIFSREILQCDIEEIKKKTSLETEIFVHGAHCISFSGNCYFSALVSGFSGNRGRCMQLCRKKYTLSCSGKNIRGYMLSAKDMRLISHIPTLRKLGVDSLKIEGRLRSAEYSGTVAEAYKNAINGKPYDKSALETVFNRGNFSNAYMDDPKADVVYPIQQNNIGSFVGKVKNFVNGTIKTDKVIKINDGDGYKILRNGKEIGGANAVHGMIRASCPVKTGDEIRLTKSTVITNRIAKAVKNDEKQINKIDYIKLSRKNKRSISDIVAIKYNLPDKCTLLCLDESCDLSLAEYADITVFAPKDYSSETISKYLKGIRRPVLLDLPVEARGRDVELLKQIIETNIFDGYVANNVYALELCLNKPVLLGSQMNLLNNIFDTPRIMSFEAATDEGAIIYAFGRQTLMNLTHCPARQLGYNCSNCAKAGEIYLTDENKNEFILRKRKIKYCYYELLNGRIVDLLPKLKEKSQKKIYVDARNVDTNRVRQVLDNKASVRFNEKNETYGRWGKGVK